MTLRRPQRIFAPSPIGSLLKHQRATVPTTTARTSDHGAADYLGLVRQLPCLSCGVDPCYEAAHVKLSSAVHGKMNMLGKRPKAKFTLPLCPDDHRLAKHSQHSQSEQAFWDKLGIDPLATCAALYAKAGDLVAMRAIVFVTIAQRDRR
jgi:hypothetical protein